MVGLSVIGGRWIRTGCRARARALPRRQGRECAADRRADPEGLSRASHVARGKLHRLRAPARDRRNQGVGRGGRMSITPRPPIPSFLPESAPYSPEQRAWLNGLFAGLYGLTEGVTPLTAQEVAQLVPGVALATVEIDDGAPWHDPAMPIADRMKLAEGKPLPRRMMAAMAQQDCGQCGYNCQDYSDALFAKTEERLNLCVPGGKETARMLKTLYGELDGAPASSPVVAATPTPTRTDAKNASVIGRSRDKPAEAVFLSRSRLNQPGSMKETWHIEFDLAESRIE